MAALEYTSLKSKYNDFSDPQAVIEINGKDFSKNQAHMITADLEVDLTSGYEASMASFRIYNCYDLNTGTYNFEAIKKYVMLGASLSIKLGYFGKVTDVFVGFIAKVNFLFEKGDLPCIEITGMDIKGIMMANNHSKQLLSKNFGDAVREIFTQAAYRKLKAEKGYKTLLISDTPDKKRGAGAAKASAETIEMVAESDYEFVVKAAKKFNYEFFCVCGNVIFRKAKNDKSPLISLGIDHGLLHFDIGYDITGLVESVEARSLDVGKGKLISVKRKLSRKISKGRKANGIIKRSAKVYIDPTISSQQQATYRAQSLMETMTYRLGSLDCECIGIPELIPGRFIAVDSFGSPAANKFYITDVIHTFHDNGFRTKLIGKAAEIANKGVF